VATLLLFGCLALRLLVLLHCLPLSPGILLYGFLLLFGRLAGLSAIFSDTSVLSLSVSGYRPGGAEGDQQYESGNSFHGVSEEKILKRFYTEAVRDRGTRCSGVDALW
jgi:hypothetical protein